MPTKSVRLLLVDDHGLVRSPLSALLDRRPDIAVVGECNDGDEALASAVQLQPDIILMDINMPHLNGIEATRLITREVPGAGVIIVSSYADDDLVRDALRAGARGYILKSSDVDELTLAIDIVRRGNSYFSESLVETMDIPELVFQAHQAGGSSTREVLTQRQREILQLLADGQSARAIGERLGISQKTVESHKTRMMQRISARNSTDLLRFAIKSGIAGLDAANEPGQQPPG